MVYCNVTSKFMEMDKRTKDKLSAIDAAAKEQKISVVNRLCDDVKAVVKNWSEDEINAWLDCAQADDGVSYPIYEMVYGAWSSCHLGTKTAAAFVVRCMFPEM